MRKKKKDIPAIWGKAFGTINMKPSPSQQATKRKKKSLASHRGKKEIFRKASLPRRKNARDWGNQPRRKASFDDLEEAAGRGGLKKKQRKRGEGKSASSRS